MTELNHKELLEREIKNAKITIEKLDEAMVVNKIVLAALEDELKKCKK